MFFGVESCLKNTPYIILKHRGRARYLEFMSLFTQVTAMGI